ncbi:hypothetical protein [Streptomyces sp. NPDC020362]|uniref:hypothetical protein n=1 Tax=unclassified Streptomyces TaxID=2593676 RepID=UPI0033C54BE2
MAASPTPPKKTPAKKTAAGSTAKNTTTAEFTRTPKPTAKTASAPAKKTAAAKKTSKTTPSSTGRARPTTRTTVRMPAIPPPRTPAPAPAEPEPATPHTTSHPAMNDDTITEHVRKVIANRRRTRQLQALKITGYLMATGCLTSIGLTIWQLTIPSLYAGAYATLAGVFAATTGITISTHRNRRNRRNNHSNHNR